MKRLDFTKFQERQLAFLDRLEPFERADSLSEIHASCNTCHIGKVFGCADGARSFIYNHRGHDTWIQYLGRKRM